MKRSALQERHGFPLLFFVINYCLLFLVTACIAGPIFLPPAYPAAVAFTLVAVAGYAGLYLLPSLLVSAVLHRWLHPRVGQWGAVGMVSITLCLLLLDSQIHGLYGFHLNGFVWNLLTTPGGIASMGGSDGTYLAVAGGGALVVGLQAVLMWLGRRSVPVARWVVVVLVLCMIGERVGYGLSDLNGYQPVLVAARSIPFYQPATFAGVAGVFGYHRQRTPALKMAQGGRLHYPLRPLRRRASPPSPNVLFLVAESLRWDMLTPEIMPNLWRFAKQHGRRYEQHVSGGNGTRMGLFSLFYGLPGNYWFSFLNARRAPVLINEFQRRDYRLGLFTSARFSYPEFDRTVFASVPGEQLHSDDKGPGWRRDRRNVDRLLSFLDEDRTPFFGFLFFESPHARYYFPPESVIRPDYLAELNYATMDLERDMPAIFNRYVNAVHHLDQQLGRVLDYLAGSGRLDDTLVVITGDHGEEFMENGRWGHNSAFHQQQIRVPLVIGGAAVKTGVVRRPTSHLDVAPTVLEHLGVTSPVSDYAVGVPLDRAAEGRYRLAASWNAVAYLGPDYTISMPLTAGGLAERAVTRADDGPVADEDAVFAETRDHLARVLKDMSRFYRAP